MDFDTFCKSDLRAVKVKDCEPVKKSDKLLKFTLDDGTGTDRVRSSPASGTTMSRSSSSARPPWPF